MDQGGSRQRNSGGAGCSNDDVMKSMTSLLLILFGKKVGGAAAPPAPLATTPLNLQTYQVGAHFEALSEPVLMAPSDSRYTEVGFNLFSVQVWTIKWGLILKLSMGAFAWQP